MERLFTDDKGITDNYDLSKKLLSLLREYAISLDEKILEYVTASVKSYLQDISPPRNAIAHLGFGSVCLELYRITSDSTYINNALTIISVEESMPIGRYSAEQIIARNFFTLLNFFGLSKNNHLLFRINLNIPKLLSYAVLEKEGIYWPYLYRLDENSRGTEERLLKLVFFELYKSFKNETFLQIADSIITKKSRTDNRRSSTLSSGIKDIILDSLVSSKEISETNLEDNYPAIAYSKAEARYILLFNKFPTIILLLNNEIPKRLNHFLNTENPIKNSHGIVAFLKFAREASKSNPELAKYLTPLLRIESAGGQLIRRYHSKKKSNVGNIHLKSNLLQLENDKFSFSRSTLVVNVKIVNIKWNPVLKIYVCVFKDHWHNSSEAIIALKYNPLTNRIEEFLANPLIAIIIRVLNREPILPQAINRISQLVDNDNNTIIGHIKKLIEEDWILIGND